MVVRRSILSLTAAIVIAACGSSMDPRSAAPTSQTILLSNRAPSVSTKMICASEAQNDINESLGKATTRSVVARWQAPTYSCTYTYGAASMRLAVQQLTNRDSATRYFDARTAKLGRLQQITGLGEAAVTTADNEVLVRKDDDVLIVDATKLPATFGDPPDTRANIAITVAATIIGCWTGS